MAHAGNSANPANPVLSEVQATRIREAAASIVRNLPPTFDTKLPNNTKKKVNKELEVRDDRGEKNCKAVGSKSSRSSKVYSQVNPK